MHGARRWGKAAAAGWVAAAVVVVGAVAFSGGFARGHGVDAGATPHTTAPREPAVPAREYRGVGLAAGSGLVLETDPPQSTPGAENGTLGFTPDGESFVSGADRATLVVLGAAAPGTLDGCRAAQGVVVAVARTQLTAGSRLCVVAADGTTALVTFRQFPGAGGPAAYATLDLTVWPERQL